MKDVLFANSARFLEGVDDPASRAHLISNLLYSLASNKPKAYGRYLEFYKEQNDKVVSHFDYELRESMHQMDIDHLTRLVQAFYLFRSTKCPNIIWRAEH